MPIFVPKNRQFCQRVTKNGGNFGTIFISPAPPKNYGNLAAAEYDWWLIGFLMNCVVTGYVVLVEGSTRGCVTREEY